MAAVRAIGILGTPRDPSFDRLVFIAAQLFNAPIAAVSLLDGDQMWYKARVGVDWEALPRTVAFCGAAVAQFGPLLVGDTSLDPRFRGSPLVTGPPGVRFFAGAPVMAPDGVCAALGAGPLPVGVLCVMDRRCRTVSSGQVAHLVQLAREASGLLGLQGGGP